MKRRLWAALLVACLAACAPAANDPAARERLLGHWLSASGNVEVEIAPCGDKICGTITQVLANRSMSGTGQGMSRADDTGLRILSDFTPAGGDQFVGRILNRENGKVYDCELRPGGPDELIVRPYVLISLFGQTQVWHRRP
jgi:uncharacterized protein (DUF2147 family)